MTTDAPSFAAARAEAFPTIEFAPVINTTLLFSFSHVIELHFVLLTMGAPVEMP
jgi:hypothetical protein